MKEKIILYTVSNSKYNMSYSISELEVFKVSDSSYWVKENGPAMRLINSYTNTYRTKPEAINYLIDKAKKLIEIKTKELNQANEFYNGAISLI